MRKLRHIENLDYLPQVAQLALRFQLMFLTTMQGIYMNKFFIDVILFVIFWLYK